MTVAFVCLLHGLAVILISAGLILARPHHLGAWANVLGITATILAAIQYVPQIWMTYHLGHVGSLSIPMMLIQTPGSFVWSASLAARLGAEGWSTWGVFLVTGCLQGCLLVMGICFEIKANRERRLQNGEEEVNGTCIVGYIPNPRVNDDTDDEGGVTERTPLNGSRKSPHTRGVS